jgi:hypothetical protein
MRFNALVVGVSFEDCAAGKHKSYNWDVISAPNCLDPLHSRGDGPPVFPISLCKPEDPEYPSLPVPDAGTRLPARPSVQRIDLLTARWFSSSRRQPSALGRQPQVRNTFAASGFRKDQDGRIRTLIESCLRPFEISIAFLKFSSG